MDKDFIINDYINFCNDLQIDANNSKSKNKFVNEFLKMHVIIHGITHYEETKKELKKILRGKTFLTSKIKY